MQTTSCALQMVPTGQSVAAQGSVLGASGSQIACGGLLFCMVQWVPGLQSTVAHGLVGSTGTHLMTGGQGALMHVTGSATQRVPAGQVAAAHASGSGSMGTHSATGGQGALMHW